MENILVTRNLSKKYGRITAIDDLSIHVGQGSVYGLLGPNGSGKTTTLAIITGIIGQDKGEYSWFGKKPASSVRKKTGALVEVPGFYPYLSLSNNLRIISTIKDIPEKDIDRVLDITRLSSRRNSRYDTLSLGMKQRLALAAVLLGNPEILVLDEPANGLDPEGIAEVREIIRMEATNRKTIILASHILDEVEKVCSHAGILKEGRIIAEGRVNELLQGEAQVVLNTDQPEKFLGIIEEAGLAKSFAVKDKQITLILRKDCGPADLNRIAFENGIVLSGLVHRKRSLESQFLELVQ